MSCREEGVRDAPPCSKTSMRFGGCFGGYWVRRWKAPSWLWGVRCVPWLLLEANPSLSRTFSAAQPGAGLCVPNRVTEPRAPRGNACGEKLLLRLPIRGELCIAAEFSSARSTGRMSEGWKGETVPPFLFSEFN